MALVSTITLEQAIASGFGYWELALSNWGNGGVLSDPVSTYYPATGTGIRLPSLVGIIIAPNSTVDRVNVAYTLSSAPTVTQTPASQSVKFESDFMTVSVARPWIGFLPGPIVSFFAPDKVTDVAPPAFTSGGSPTGNTVFGDIMRPDGGITTPFGTALKHDPPDPVWTNPVLRVHLYTAIPPSPQLSRAPLMYGFSPDKNMSGTESIVFVFPCGGRRLLRIMAQNHGGMAGDIAEMRVMGVTGAASPGFNMEYQLTPTTGVATIPGAGGVVDHVIDRPQAMFCAIRMRVSAGTPVMYVNVEAED